MWSSQERRDIRRILEDHFCETAFSIARLKFMSRGILLFGLLVLLKSFGDAQHLFERASVANLILAMCLLFNGAIGLAASDGLQIRES